VTRRGKENQNKEKGYERLHLRNCNNRGADLPGLVNHALVGPAGSNSNRGCDIIRVVFVALVGLGVVFRLLHLFGSHYPLLGTDSYYFHAEANRLADGGSVGVDGSGLIYPVAYLPSAAYWLPLVIFGLSALLMYRFAVKFLPRWGALACVGAYAILPQSVILTAAGNIDRDGVVTLLTAMAVMIFWQTKDKYPDIFGSMMVCGVSMVITFLWVDIGRWVLLGTCVAVFLSLIVTRSINDMKRPAVSIGIVAVITVVVSLVTGEYTGTINATERYAELNTGIAETNELTLAHVLSCYGFLMIFVVMGLIMVVKSRQEYFMVAVWFLVVFAVAVISQRLLVFAVFPASILAGIAVYRSVEFICGAEVEQPIKNRVMAILCGFLAVVMVFTGWQASQIGGLRGMAPDAGWVEALDRLQKESSGVVACYPDQWKWVYYWLGQRPVRLDDEWDYAIVPFNRSNPVYADEVDHHIIFERAVIYAR